MRHLNRSEIVVSDRSIDLNSAGAKSKCMDSLRKRIRRKVDVVNDHNLRTSTEAWLQYSRKLRVLERDLRLSPLSKRLDNYPQCDESVVDALTLLLSDSLGLSLINPFASTKINEIDDSFISNTVVVLSDGLDGHPKHRMRA